MARGVVARISRSHVQRILQAADVRAHRVQQWLHSPDPAFREKVNEICKLYRKVPRNAVVLSIDEKTGIQAIERKHRGCDPAPGRLRRREFEYVRHGTPFRNRSRSWKQKHFWMHSRMRFEIGNSAHK